MVFLSIDRKIYGSYFLLQNGIQCEFGSSSFSGTISKTNNCHPMSSNKPSSTRLSSDQKPAFTYADVVFNLPLKDAFTYEVPLHFNGMVKKGMRVFVPFGRRRLTGYVVSISNHNKKNISLKAIEEVPDSEPVISKELLSLTR